MNLQQLGIAAHEHEIDGLTIDEHNLKRVNGSITCSICETAFDIPDIIRRTSNFRQVMFRLYTYGKFKQIRCSQGFSEAFRRPDSVFVHMPDGEWAFDGNVWCSRDGSTTLSTEEFTNRYQLGQFEPNSIGSIDIDDFHSEDAVDNDGYMKRLYDRIW